MMRPFNSYRFVAIILIHLFYIPSNYTSAQSKKQLPVKIYGTFSSQLSKEINLISDNNFNESIDVDAGKFTKLIIADTGFYTLEKYVIYLEPGFDLKIDFNDSTVNFQGKGSLENRLVSEISLLVRKYIPFDGTNISKSFNEISPTDFIKSLRDYQVAANGIIQNSKISIFFRRAQLDNVEYLVRYYLNYYNDNYGIDPAKRTAYLLAANNNRKASIKMNPLELLKLAKDMRFKSMSFYEHEQFQSLIWSNFDLNNGTLHSFSLPYRELLDKQLTILTRAAQKQLPTFEHELVTRFDIAEKHISNKVIKEYVLYNATIVLLQSRVKNSESIYKRYVELSTNSRNLEIVNKYYYK